MLFNSYIFVFLFLPLCLVGYFGLNHIRQYTFAQLFLFCMSLWFYGYFNPSYLPIILVSIVFNYSATQFFRKISNSWLKKTILAIALAFNIGILFYYKYTDFFLENINLFFHKNFALRNILLPLGISFFTFQQLSFVIDAYRGETLSYNFLQYASFVVYFPQLIAGPIVTHDELVPQFQDVQKKHFQWDHFSRGLFIFALGMGKKVLLADTFGNAVNWGYSNISSLDSTNAFLVMVAYTLQIYFDFSGYCDMAIGIGQMMNIDLPVNFDSPYKALTITEFWSRWHKTLTRFFTKYIYIPLGGNRRGKFRTYLNTFIVFSVSGLWHGASWTFIIWGVLHGIFMILTRHWKKLFERVPPVLSWCITFLFLNFTWVIFRAEGVTDTIRFFRALFSMEFGPILPDILSPFHSVCLRFFTDLLPASFSSFISIAILTGYYVLSLISVIFFRNSHQKMQSFSPNFRTAVITAILLIWCIFSFSGISTFLYFNF